MIRSVLIGSVESSKSALSALYQQPAMGDVVAVAGLSRAAASNVSGYCNLGALARSHNTPYLEFENVNDKVLIEVIRNTNPDVIWVVGLSQLLGQELLEVPRIGCIGFHPTKLPAGRGRAPVAWSIMKSLPMAATFFLIDPDGVDSGPILSQIDVAIPDGATSGEAIELICDAIPDGIEAACKRLLNNDRDLDPQDALLATYLGVRRDRDGVINWFEDSRAIERLIKAAAPPYPGAWSFVRETRVRLLDAEIERSKRWCGVPGRILEIGTDKSLVVATVDGAVRILNFTAEKEIDLRVGVQFGSNLQAEVFSLRRKISALEQDVLNLSEQIRTLRSGIMSS